MNSKFKNMFFKSKFANNVLILITGTTIAQAIPIVISPILTRIYTPEDFGVLALFVAITSVVATACSGRYELAIVLPKDDEDAINIFALGFIINITVSLLFFLVVLIFHNYILQLLDKKTLGFWLYLSPLVVFFIGSFNLLHYFHNRKTWYKDLRNATIIKSIILASVQLFLGLIKQGFVGLITGQCFSHFFANLKLAKNILREKELLSKINKKKMIMLAKRYKKFPLLSMPSAFCNTFSNQLPILLLESFFSSAIGGFYSLANKIINMPLSLIGNSIAQVFFQEISKSTEDKEKMRQLTSSVFKKLLLLGLLPFSILTFFGDYLFSFVFGQEWLIAGYYVQLLSPWFFVVFLISPISLLAISLEKQKQLLIFDVVTIVCRLLAIISGAYFFQSGVASVFLFGLISFILWIVWGIYLLTLANVKFRDVKVLINVFPVFFVFGLIRFLIIGF